MIEAARRISILERRVSRRNRLLQLQDSIALAVLITSVVAALVILYLRIKPQAVPAWAVLLGAITLAATVATLRWLSLRTRNTKAAFLIDEELNLADRVASARTVIDRGGPERPVEIALIEDAAARIESADASNIVKYRLPRRYAFSALGLLLVVGATLIPQRTLPVSLELEAERAEIQIAAERLEEASKEVEQIAPAGTETATLAREQAELGAAMRRTNDGRAEVLKKLSALGERIQRRHDELADTRADEVVTLAEQRLRDVTKAKLTSRSGTKAANPEGELAAENPKTDSNDKTTSDEKLAKAKAGTVAEAVKENQPGQGERARSDSREKPADDRTIAKVESRVESGTKPKDDRAPDPSTQVKQPQSPPGQLEGTTAQDSTRKSEQRESSSGGTAPNKADEKAGLPESEALDSRDPKQSDQGSQKQSESSDSKSQIPGALAGEMAEQAAKMAPGLSEQLLNKAAELRVNDLKPEDIKQLQQAAQLLARDLSRIAQSKEFQQAVEQLAKQVNPEQLEKVASELAKQEGLKRELEAAAKLLAENQEVRQMVAGLAQQFAQQKDSLRPPQGNASRETQSLDLARGSKPEKGIGPGAKRSVASKLERAYGDERSTARNREEVLTGKLQGRTGGEFLYLQAAPGKGATRASYSSAYPKYRRAAERSVERSQVPARMRTVVRDYFDAINPDAKKNK